MASEEEVHVLRVLDFSEIPGARFYTDGKYSGEAFRDECLEPAFVKAQKAGVVLLVDLDGTYPYATSFLEEAFGGLARKFGIEAVQEGLKIKSDDEKQHEARVRRYIAEANDPKRQSQTG